MFDTKFIIFDTKFIRQYLAELQDQSCETIVFSTNAA